MKRPDSVEVEFETVLAAARSAEPWALERIYSALAPGVAGLLRVQGEPDPDDLTSEVFLGVLRNLATFDGDEASFRSWVFTIAYRRLFDERRRRSRRPPTVPLEPGHDAVATVDVQHDVERLLATQRVRALCERLVPGQRDVLLLRLIGRLTVNEVALVIDRSPRAVKALQRRGFAAIARLLEQEGVPL